MKGMDLETAWDTVIDDLPPLKPVGRPDPDSAAPSAAALLLCFKKHPR
jgi:hypothetical protein